MEGIRPPSARGSLGGDVRRATRECSNVARTQGPLAMQTARGRHRLRSSVMAAGKGSLWLAERLTNCLRCLRETSPPVTTGIKQVAGEKCREGDEDPRTPAAGSLVAVVIHRVIYMNSA